MTIISQAPLGMETVSMQNALPNTVRYVNKPKLQTYHIPSDDDPSHHDSFQNTYLTYASTSRLLDFKF